MFNECHIHLCDFTLLNVFPHAQFFFIKHKNIFECFNFFWIVFVFAKIVKNFKNRVALFQRLSCGLVQSHAPVASPHKDFSRLTGASMSQSRKILKIFFKIWVFNVFRSSVWQLAHGWKVQPREYIEIFAAYLTTSSWVELLVMKNTYRKFLKIFVLSVLATSPGDLLAT